MIELPARYQKKISPEPNTGCWLWTGSLDDEGYPVIRKPRPATTKERAHRAVYAFYCGEIPVGRVLDHTCRVRSCVNPDHLEPVTDLVNVLRGVGPSAQNKLKTICCNGHSLADAYVIRSRDRLPQRRCRECVRTAIKGETTP